MKIKLVVLMVFIFSLPSIAQKPSSAVQLVSVKAGNNQKDSSFVDLDISGKLPVRLNYDQNYLHFYFINSTNPSNKSFSYKLNGLDYSWITCQNCSEAIYAHLDGGDYTFQVKSSEASAMPVKFSFSLEGNIWNKWWFVPMLFMYFLVFMGIGIYFLVLYQFRQKMRNQLLLHKEKMNSMTELTAGIAHEIQNPLNFVKNFAELSMDLAKELKEETEKTEFDKGLIIELATDLSQNQEKINHHGKRASSIVKSMLEHSRKSTGQKELTDINKLAEEYLNLSYHGLKAKDPTFSCDFKTDFEGNLPKMMVVPQDLGRVLLNLINNAFYAVNERSKKEEMGYKPKVTVSTQLTNNNQQLIAIKDNGIGMSDVTKAKIFQPFFTTKPTGEGTGLGLSLAYDIVTKGHGGIIECESIEGEGTTFLVKIPR